MDYTQYLGKVFLKTKTTSEIDDPGLPV